MRKMLCWLCLVAAVVMAACGSTVVLHETTPVTVTANRPAPPPPPEEPPPPPPPPPRVQVEQTRIRVDEQIHFQTNAATILPDSDGLLTEIAQVINQNPQIGVIRIEGHTDSQGNGRYNRVLSQRRADAVVARLVQNGVAPGRMQAQGFGEERPVGSNDTEEGRAQNRRVEFNIVDQQGDAGAGAGEGGVQ